jgi:hypothetical protein
LSVDIRSATGSLNVILLLLLPLIILVLPAMLLLKHLSIALLATLLIFSRPSSSPILLFFFPLSSPLLVFVLPALSLILLPAQALFAKFELAALALLLTLLILTGSPL